MSMRIGLVVTALVLMAGCGTDLKLAKPVPSHSQSASETPAEEPWVVAPGRIGPVETGMTLEEALATGAIESTTNGSPEDCPRPALQWKAPNTDKLDLRDHDDTIAVLGVRDAMFKTADGVGVDSSWAEVQAAYPGAKLEESSASGSLIYLKDRDKWLAIAFNEQPEDLTDASKVVYMEVETGQKPIAYPDGC